MGKPIVNLDPYNIPPHLVPPGMIYQWVAKKSFTRIDSQYQAMIEAGWSEVPYKRLEKHYHGRYRGEGTEILIGGQVLMERAKEKSVVARDKEIDKALTNAGSGRSAAVDLTAHVKLSAHELNAAVADNLSSPEYISRKIKMIANGADDSLIRGREGSLVFMHPPIRSVSKYRWLDWLFDLISTKERCDD